MPAADATAQPDPDQASGSAPTSTPTLTPDDIATHHFGTSFRGYDTGEVRAWLATVAEAHRALIERAEAADRLAGEKLAAAETRAAEVLREAQDEAKRVLGEVVGERERAYEEGVARAEAVIAEAEADRARIEREGRAEGERLVGEAQAARKRVLADLNRRRKQARTQVEQLHAARERLLASLGELKGIIEVAAEGMRDALPAAKAAADAAARRVEADDDTTPEQLEAEIESLRLAGLAMAPTDEEGDDGGEGGGGAGESGSASAAAGGTAAERRSSSVRIVRPLRSQDPVTGLPEEELLPIEAPDPEEAVRIVASQGAAGEAEGTEGGAGAAATTSSEAGAGEDLATETAGGDAGDDRATGDAAAAADADVTAEAPDEAATRGEAAPAISTLGRSTPGKVYDVEADEADASRPAAEGRPSTEAVDALFARLKAGRQQSGATNGSPAPAEATETAPAAEDTEPAPAAGPDAVAVHRGGGADRETMLARRDAAVAPATTALTRRLKRLLNDEQNELLDALRREGTGGALPAADEHAARWAETATADLRLAASAGSAAFAATERPPAPEAGDLAEVAQALAAAVAGPLRARLEQVMGEADGDADVAADAVRATYRTWRTERLGPAVQHAVLDAFSAGVSLACPAGTPVCWVADDGGVPCPDAEDNALAGVVVAGEPFPTGHLRPPAHPGCRCLVVPAAD